MYRKHKMIEIKERDTLKSESPKLVRLGNQTPDSEDKLRKRFSPSD